MDTILTLDVTVIDPRYKHPTIFEKFDALVSDTAFIIHNDHDPKPLYYQLLAERGKVFTWDYLENGPEIWKVKIGKTGTQTQETIGEIVAKDYRKAQVFKKLGIDFCCGGKKTLNEVCDAKGVDMEAVKVELSAAQNVAQTLHDFDKWHLDFLVDYIINIHHSYVKENIPFIQELATKVANVHSESHPEAIEVATIFKGLAADLSLHLMKEEKVLFPYIKELVCAQTYHKAVTPAIFGTVDNPTQMMEAEHEHAGQDLVNIRKVTDNYTLPEDACTSYSILYQKLQEFENDLFTHVHLENNILFPKAIKLERELVV